MKHLPLLPNNDVSDVSQMGTVKTHSPICSIMRDFPSPVLFTIGTSLELPQFHRY